MCSSRKGISVTPTGCATNSCLFRKIKKYEQIGHLGQVFRGVMLNAYSHFFFSLFPTFAKAMNLYVYMYIYICNMLLIYVDLGKDKKEGQSFTWTHVGSVQLQNCGSCMVASRSDCLEPQRSGIVACIGPLVAIGLQR